MRFNVLNVFSYAVSVLTAMGAGAGAQAQEDSGEYLRRLSVMQKFVTEQKAAQALQPAAPVAPVATVAPVT